MSNDILLVPSEESKEIIITNGSGMRWFSIVMIFGEDKFCSQLVKAQFRAWSMRSI